MADPRPKRYWKSPAGGADRRPSGDSAAERAALSRRNFLKAAGFTFAGAALSGGCQRAPVQRAIPLLNQPEGIVPGRASYYASTCGACPAGCGILVKTRDGRPIKLEGNPDHPVSRGGLCAVGQASILGLYDRHRLATPLTQGAATDWNAVDAAIRGELDAIQAKGGAVRFLSGTVTSPTTRRMIEQFLARFDDGRHVAYDALSCAAILEAHRRTHAARVLPRYHFEKAEVIVGFDADFLGTWISPVEFTAGYCRGRQLGPDSPRFSHHVQFESRLSLTGSRADQRVVIAPHELTAVLQWLATWMDRRAGAAEVERPAEAALPVAAAELEEIAERMWSARGRSLVICDSQRVEDQVLCNRLNHLLGNYGTTVDLQRPSRQRQGDDRALGRLVKELSSGRVSALFVYGVNPVYDLPDGRAIADAMRKTPLTVCLTQRPDETAAAARYVCPVPHYLETWTDAEPVAGIVAVAQPVVPPLNGARSAFQSLAVWSGQAKPADQLVRETWEGEFFQRRRGGGTFTEFWDRTVHDGYAEIGVEPVSIGKFRGQTPGTLPTTRSSGRDGYRLVLYPKVGMLDGRPAYNPWLQELPDPITKTTWDNYACLSPAAAGELGVGQGDIVRIEPSGANERTDGIELPVFVQPGQHDRVVAVALGYGSELTRRFAGIGPHWLQRRPTVNEAGLVGINAAPLLQWSRGLLNYVGRPIRIAPTGGHRALACTQEHQQITVPKHLAPAGGARRPVIRETTLAELQGTGADDEHHTVEHADLWPDDHPYRGHHWGMAIDLTACTGCSACVIACQVENNIPVVGRDEVRRNRELHWLRVDRYYSDRPGGGVDVAHQPMLCHHCDNAPCETVCPVLATVHSDEGLNQQVYNRCVGTRYCSNNCPYKVRRFNWFDYRHDDLMANLVLNPDVTVRSRGVMEKCSFCVQRIQEAKIEARRRGRKLADGEIQPACQQSCPAGAIVFGDLNDPDSRLVRQIRGGRYYRVLEEINVRPSVGYLSLVRNREQSEVRQSHG